MSQIVIPPIPSDSPFPAEAVSSLNALLGTLDREQAAWLRGFLSAVTAPPAVSVASAAAVSGPQLTVLFGSESGNCEGLADAIKTEATKKGFSPNLVDMADQDVAKLDQIENLLVVVSTWGEGDPPSRAEDFYDKFMGEGAPKLEKMRFSVCGLGDTSYAQFCQMGKDFDKRLAELGAQRIYDRQDCDVDFEGPAASWMSGALGALAEIAKPDSEATVPQAAASAAPTVVTTPAGPEYSKKNPFPAPLLNKIDLNGTGSAKETIHAEISLEGSGLTYEPGDALAVVPENAADLIEDFLKVTGIQGRENVAFQDKLSVPFETVLRRSLDLRTVSKTLLQKYAKMSGNQKLLEKSEDREWVKEYAWGRDWVDVVTDYPSHGMRAGDFLRLLRPLAARLYSIASSVAAHPGEVHLTVAAVRYDAHGRGKKGVCSTFIADQWREGATADVYFHHNKNFRLPADGDVPIIMVGPGTGIAPFRAFVEERAASDAKGESWLLFGDQHYLYDFLYQTEWQDYLKRGKLSRLDLAFSRDQPQKIYVQDRMRENAAELWSWLDRGAYFYVCGDASRMAKDVHQALLDIVAEEGGKSPEDAAAYVKKMQKERRYGRDVY